jgi:preprotein translocase subunit YajC
VPLLIVLVLGLAVMYVVMIRPQRQRQARHQTLIDALGVGEDVLTTGGIYGTVTQVEGDDLVVEIADGVAVHMTRRGIAAVLPPEDGEDEDEDFEDDENEDLSSAELDEAAVAGKEEIVTSAVDQDSRSGDRR